MQARTKSSWADLVTNIDLNAQEAILQVLSGELPGVQVIGEEKENERISGEVIYVDPLDGTLNYFHGLNQFAVSLGYWVERRPVAGVVFNPIDDELFFAFAGKGAFRNEEAIRVSSNRSLSQCFLATGWPYEKDEVSKVLRSLERVLPPVQEVRVLGSSALAMCYIAAGILDGYWEWGPYPWDIAAGVVIAQEAGARITSPEGETFKLESGTILATNGYIHPEMVKLFQTDKG